MFCPQCGCEYREGFSSCADCNVPLVDALPPAESAAAEEDVRWVDVCHPLNMGQTMIVKSLLQSESIPFVIEGENLNTLLAPFQPIPSRVRVPEKYAERARDFLKDLT